MNDHKSTHEVSEGGRDPRFVFVVHGRNIQAKESLFQFLTSIGLQPLPFEVAKNACRHPSPYIGQVLDTAFEQAQAIVVLMTPDDEARLRSQYHPRRGRREPNYETQLTPQARPNVLFEAGMAMGRCPERTILVELGELRPFSDIAGRVVIRLDNSEPKRKALADCLQKAECPVNLENPDWRTAGDFEIRDSETLESLPVQDDRALMTPDDIVSAFSKIPDFSHESVEQNCQALYVRLKYSHIDTRKQLDELVSSIQVLDALRTLYIQELLRPGPFPLDPYAIATWGVFLFINGVTEETVAWVREQLRQSEEYRQKH